MIRILFICHGNICRSPMAEFILKYNVDLLGITDVYVSSAATSYEEIGNDIYPSAKATLSKHHIPYERKFARHITKDDYFDFDYLFCMDKYNLRNLMSFYDSDPDNKIKLLLDSDISDPWYTGDFELTFSEISKGVENLINVYL